MQCADEPTESYVVVERLQAAPCFRSRWHVDHGQQNPRNNLQNEDCQRGTPEYIKPARCISWNGMLRGFANGTRQLQAALKPVSDLADQAHGSFFPTRPALDPGVNSSPA